MKTKLFLTSWFLITIVLPGTLFSETEWINKDFKNTTGHTRNDLHWAISGHIKDAIVDTISPPELPDVNIVETGPAPVTWVEWSGGDVANDVNVHCGIKVEWDSIPGKRFRHGAYWTQDGSLKEKVSGCASVNIAVFGGAIEVNVANTEDINDPPLDVSEFSYALVDMPVELADLTWNNPSISWTPLPWFATIPPGGSVYVGAIPMIGAERYLIIQMAVNFSGDPPSNAGHIIVQRMIPVNEWSDITYIEGNYSRIYLDFIVLGGTGTFYCINDWMVNQDDEGVDGGLLSNEYNRFNFTMGGDDYEIRIYPDGSGEIYKNDILDNNSLPGFESATSWVTSPNIHVNHTIWEFSFVVPGTITTVASFSSCDPVGPDIVVIQNPPDPPSILTSGPSAYPHYIDGEFADMLAMSTLPPVPARTYQEPVRDPFFDEFDDGEGWTIELQEEGGVQIHTTGILPDCLIGGNAGPSEYTDWVAWGKPDCWCYCRQCRGDADGKKTGPFWVTIPDLTLFKAAYGKVDAVLATIPNGICADLDHKKTGPFRVTIPDLAIFKAYYGKTVVPNCNAAPVITGPYNFWCDPVNGCPGVCP